jgi:hypothetical protein
MSGTGEHFRSTSAIQRPPPLNEPLDAWAAMAWPGAWFVRDAAPGGRLAVLYAAALGARAGHDYLGCEHLVAGSLRAGALDGGETSGAMRSVAAEAVSASQRIAEIGPEVVEAWFADDAGADPHLALASLRLLPTLSPRAGRALQRARSSAAAAAAIAGPGAIHVLSGVLADPGIVGPAATSIGVSLEPARRWAERRAAWGPLLELLDEA